MRNLRIRVRSALGANIAEFAPALFLFFLLLFPLINLVGYAWSVATATLITHDCARAASEAPDYTTALTAMQNKAQQDLASGFGVFAHLTPSGGYAGCGADLYVTVTDVNTQTPVSYGPNTPVPPPIDSTKNIYEYQVKALFNVKPFLNLASLPFIGSVPMIGRSTQLNSVAFRAVEEPQGLGPAIATAPSAPGTGSSGSSPPTGGVPAGGNNPGGPIVGVGGGPIVVGGGVPGGGNNPGGPPVGGVPSGGFGGGRTPGSPGGGGGGGGGAGVPSGGNNPGGPIVGSPVLGSGSAMSGAGSGAPVPTSGSGGLGRIGP